MRILVVDDDAVVARSIARLLGKHEVVIATDPDSVLDRVRAGEWFDLIVCDLNMPGTNGARVLSQVKLWFGSDAPMLVLMSGSDDITTASCDAVLYKPFTGAELRSMVEALNERRALRCTEQTTRLPLVLSTCPNACPNVGAGLPRDRARPGA